ncbi:MAG: M13 family metallopeptidase [Thermoanaerobaculia bacterium]
MRSDATRDTLSPNRTGGSVPAGALPILLAALALAPARPAVAQAPAGADSSRPASAVGATVAPGDDFYAYANAAWLAATAIPEGRERWGARDELEQQARRRIAELLDAARCAPAGTPARRVADFHAAYLDEAGIERRGLAALRPLLDSFGTISDRVELARRLGRGVRADVDPLGLGVYRSAAVLGLAVEQSIHGEPANVAFLLQGGLGLPDREDYLGADAGRVDLRARYLETVRTLLGLAGFDRAGERAAAVLALETALARDQATREASANDRNADNVWRRSDFARRAPGMDWPAFLEAAGLAGQEEIVVWQPTAVTGLAAQVASQPLESWRDYLRFHAILEVADVLPRALADPALALRAASAAGPAPSRAERALAATQGALGDALGRMYAERYFPAERKARIERIGEQVRAALLERVAAATWMSPATRASALAKLRTVYVGIGYPDRWQDDPALSVDPADALGNLRRAAESADRRALARLGRPVDLETWTLAPQRVGALLVFQQNAYVMAAALLEPPKYDPASSDAAAYGSVGALIGHDLTHYIDTLGADYDPEHRMRRWWTAEDLRRFQALARPLVDQFSAYRPLPDLAVDGELTLTENIADLGGLAAAFDAYRAALGGRATDADVVRAQDREFFLAYARTQRRAIREAALRQQVAQSDHAPEDLRAATVRNLDAWYDAFDVRPGQRLYLEPAARVRIW